MSLERRRVDAGPPDIGFRAGAGFYLGLVAGGLVAVAGLLADVTTATLLGALPTVVTAMTIVGYVLAGRARGWPERLGRSRRLRLVWYLPAVGFGAAGFAPPLTPLPSTPWYLAVTIVLTVLTGVAAYGLERLCRNRYVEAVTADEPIVTWTYQPAGLLADGTAWAAVAVLAVGVTLGGFLQIATGDWWVGLFWIAVVVFPILLASGSDDRTKRIYGTEYGLQIDSDGEWGTRELSAHDAGIRLDRGRSTTLVPWESITGVELTDDELVLERRFRSLRCDRSAIDDPEATLEALVAARARRAR